MPRGWDHPEEAGIPPLPRVVPCRTATGLLWKAGRPEQVCITTANDPEIRQRAAGLHGEHQLPVVKFPELVYLADRCLTGWFSSSTGEEEKRNPGPLSGGWLKRHRVCFQTQ